MESRKLSIEHLVLLANWLKTHPEVLEEAMAELVELTKYIAGQASAFDVQVILRAAEVPECRLNDEGADAPRLGVEVTASDGLFLASGHTTRRGPAK